MAVNQVPPPPGGPWQIAVIEDEPDIRDQICQWLREASPCEGRTFEPKPFEGFAEANASIADRKFDIVVLDIFEGRGGGVPPSPGVDVIRRIKESTFTPIVVYTALPERLGDIQSPFIRVVAKVDGLDRLEGEIRRLLQWRLPQLSRALREAFDVTLRDYMWGFVAVNWAQFEAIVAQPDFGRLVVQRLADAYSSYGASSVLGIAYGDVASFDIPPDEVHPASVYVMPPRPNGLRLGDIRKLVDGEGKPQYFVLLQPTCDTVKVAGDKNGKGARTPNVERVLCARAQSKPYRKDEHSYRLPAFLSVPELRVEFRDLLLIPLKELASLECVATVASPFAEQLAASFASYIGRIGTPEFHTEAPSTGP